jgi:hypothetical protein
VRGFNISLTRGLVETKLQSWRLQGNEIRVWLGSMFQPCPPALQGEAVFSDMWPLMSGAGPDFRRCSCVILGSECLAVNSELIPDE